MGNRIGPGYATTVNQLLKCIYHKWVSGVGLVPLAVYRVGVVVLGPPDVGVSNELPADAASILDLCIAMNRVNMNILN